MQRGEKICLTTGPMGLCLGHQHRGKEFEMFNKAIDLTLLFLIAFLAWPIVMLLPALPLAIFSALTGIQIAPWFMGVCGIPLAIYVARAFVEML